MRNSDKKKETGSQSRTSRIVKKTLEIVIKVAVSLFVFHLISSGLDYMTSPASSYTRIQFHDLYTRYGKDGENIDLLFLGTSHAYRAFDPAVFDEDLNVNSYNFGTSMQTITASYHILKEVLKTNHPDKVVFELTYTCFRDKEHMPLKSVIVSQYMKPSWNKLSFILNEFSFEDIFYAILPAYTYRNKLTASKIGSTLRLKESEAYKNYDVSITKRAYEWMEYKGYVYTNKSFRNLHLEQMDSEPFEEDMLYPKYLEDFQKMADLCKEEGIEFVCVTAPLPKPTLLELGNYGEVCDFLNELTEKNGITYYDFNLIKEDWLPLKNGNFYDTTHINGRTSKVFSDLVSHIFAEEDAGTLDRDKYFYRDWEEAKSHLDYVASAYLTVDADEENYILTGHGTSGVDDAKYEYSYWLYTTAAAEKNAEMLRDWSTDPVYVMPKDFKDGKWKVMVAVRFAGDEETDMMHSQRAILTFPQKVAEEEEEEE